MTQSDDSNIDIGKRHLLRAIGGSGFASMTATGALASGKSGDDTGGSNNGGGDHSGTGPGEDGRGRGEFPKIPDEKVPDAPVSSYATQIALHPNHDRAALSTAVFADVFELYVAEGVEDRDSVANALWRITDSDDLELAPAWRKENLLQYNQGFVRYERKLPPSNKVFESRVIEDPSFAGVNSL